MLASMPSTTRSPMGDCGRQTQTARGQQATRSPRRDSSSATPLSQPRKRETGGFASPARSGARMDTGLQPAGQRVAGRRQKSSYVNSRLSQQIEDASKALL